MNYDTIKRLIDNNDYDKAIEELDLLIETNPNDDEAHYLKGRIYQRKLQWDNAIASYSKAIELNADSKAVVALEMLYDILSSMNNKIIET